MLVLTIMSISHNLEFNCYSMMSSFSYCCWQAEKVFNQDLYFKRTVKSAGEPMSHLESIASSAVRYLTLETFVCPQVINHVHVLVLVNVGPCCHQGKGISYHLFHFFRKSCKVCFHSPSSLYDCVV